MKLDPSEAQRKAMITYLSTPVHISDPFAEPDYGGWLVGLFAAANSIPEGAPVGTIARRPDGRWKAERFENPIGGAYWHYTISAAYTGGDMPPIGDDADSWPVIYVPESPYAPYAEVPGPSGDKYREKLADPTAQQEPKRFPGIENPTTADHVGADNADEQLKLVFSLRDIRIERGLTAAYVGEALCLEDSEVERFESGSTNPTMSMIRRYARAVEAVFTVDVRKWEDTTHSVPPESTNCVPKPREPRVRDRLGVDEQGARWAAESGGVYHHDGSQWVTTYRHGGVTRWGKGFEPHAYEYTEILEPRVLPSLDCAEARDGTVWTKDNPVSPGRRFQFVSGIWMTRNDDDDWYRLNCDGLLCGSGYTEVIGDPVQ